MKFSLKNIVEVIMAIALVLTSINVLILQKRVIEHSQKLEELQTKLDAISKIDCEITFN